MAQVSRYPLPKDIEKKIYELFLDAVADVKTSREVEAFVNDFLTPTERVMLPKRLAIALLLSKGYEQRLISRYLKVSFTTITRVSNLLRVSGAGYRRVIDKIIVDEHLATFLQKIDDALVALLGPPGGLNWSRWHENRRRKKMKSNSLL